MKPAAPAARPRSKSIFQSIKTLSRQNGRSSLHRKIGDDGTPRNQENLSRLVRIEEELLHLQAGALPSPENARNAFLFTACPDQNVLRREVNSLMERYEGIAGVFSGTDGEGYRFVLGSRNIDLKELLPFLRSGGFKCGGGKEQVQGSAALSEAEIRAVFAGQNF